MELKAAILCIDCEWVYERSSTCTRCGSHVGFPLSRALAGRMAARRAAVTFARPLATPAPPARPRLPAVGAPAEETVWSPASQPRRSIA